jgi:hypothetical protein
VNSANIIWKDISIGSSPRNPVNRRVEHDTDGQSSLWRLAMVHVVMLYEVSEWDMGAVNITWTVEAADMQGRTRWTDVRKEGFGLRMITCTYLI